MEIILTQGMVAKVDDIDYIRLSKFKWHAVKNGNTWYARRSVSRNEHIYLHREILGLTDQSIKTDHIDGNGLNCTRENLRVCSHAQNNRNSSKNNNNTSGFKGVSKHRNKWRATIHVNNSSIYLGLFDTAINAAEEYDKAAKKYFGEFARLNGV